MAATPPPSPSPTPGAQHPHQRPRPTRSAAQRAGRWLRGAVWGLFSVAAVLLLAAGGLWWWAGTEGSLATVLGWAGKSQPVAAQGTTGALRGGGHVDVLSWQQDGLSVKAADVTLSWQPLSLLHGELTIAQLKAATVVIDDQRPPSTAAPSGPPTTLRLPLAVALDDLTIGSLSFQGAPAGPSPGPNPNTPPAKPFVASNIAGRYQFDGVQHTVVVSRIQVADGTYKASATLLADAPLTLSAQVDGVLAAQLPATDAKTAPVSVPLTVQLTAKGALTDLLVDAAVQVTAKAATEPNRKAATVATLKPQATAKARITPWAAQPLPQADVRFRDLDLAAFVPQAPQTLLTGSASIQPIAPTTQITTNATANASNPTSSSTQFWAVQAQLTNAISGPWDQQRLPLDSLDTAGQWQNGTAVLQSFKAQLGGGDIVASGQWTAPPAPVVAAPGKAASSPSASATTPHVTPPATPPAVSPATPQNWALQATLQGINPALLYSTLAPFPLGGEAAVRSQGAAIGFDARLKGAAQSQAVAAAATRPSPRKKPAGPNASSASSALRLRDANVTGSWDPSAAGGTLTLSALQVRTNDAALTGQLVAQPAQPGGKGSLNFTAPGLDARVQGELRPTSGKGDARVRGYNAAALLAWLRTLPGLPSLPMAVTSASATGSADIVASWTGGWRDPAVNATLAVPLLDIRMAGPASAATTPTAPVKPPTTPAIAAATEIALPNTLKLQGVQASLSGRLSQAQLSAQGAVAMDQRRITLQLAADGGRATAGATLAASSWQGVIKQLSVAVVDPALGSQPNNALAANNAWTLATRAQVSLSWQPVTQKGTAGGLQTSAGQASLNAPSSSSSRVKTESAVIAWQPIRWRDQSFASAGKVTGLPLAWAEVLAGPQLASNGVSGDVVFNGEWDAQLTDTLRLTARLARASGDLAIKTTSAEGVPATLSAGIRQAEVSVSNDGDALKLALRWDSERAGSAEGQLSTRLSRAAPRAGNEAASPTPGEPGLGGWTWPANAPLNGQLRAQLPKVGVWSVLAPPGWRLRGSLGADITISGTRTTPQLAGTLQADDMALRSVVDGFEFGNGKLRARLDGTRLLINEFTLYGAGGPSGGGVLAAQGEAGLLNGKPNVLLNAKLTRLRASIRSDRQLTVSGDIAARLQGQNADVTGKLVVDQALITLPDEGTPQLGSDVVVRKAPVPGADAKTAAAQTPKPNSSTTPSAAAAQLKQQQQQALDAPLQTAEQSRPVKLAVELDLGQDFRVRGKGIDTRVTGSLNVSGDATRGPRLVGTLNTVGGQYRAYGQRLDVEQGVLRFTGPVDNPTLDILALRADAIQVSQRVGVQINGTALLPRIRLYAQPDLPDAEKLSWLITGKPTASGGAEAALLQQAALALLGSKTGDTGGGIASSLGLDELSFKGGSNNANGSTSEAAVTLGKRFSRNFYAAYERSVSGALGTLYIFYDLSKRFTVRAQAGQQSAVDLIYTLQYD